MKLSVQPLLSELSARTESTRDTYKRHLVEGTDETIELTKGAYERAHEMERDFVAFLSKYNL